MTRRERQSIGRVSDRRRIGYQRGRRILGQEDCWNVVACEYLCRRFARLLDRKSTRLNSSHLGISYAVFCLKKKQNILRGAQKEKHLNRLELRSTDSTSS